MLRAESNEKATVMSGDDGTKPTNCIRINYWLDSKVLLAECNKATGIVNRIVLT